MHCAQGCWHLEEMSQSCISITADRLCSASVGYGYQGLCDSVAGTGAAHSSSLLPTIRGDPVGRTTSFSSHERETRYHCSVARGPVAQTRQVYVAHLVPYPSSEHCGSLSIAARVISPERRLRKSHRSSCSCPPTMANSVVWRVSTGAFLREDRPILHPNSARPH